MSLEETAEQIVIPQLVERFRGDEILAGMISTYKGQPAVLSIDPVPQDVEFPFIVFDGFEIGDEYGTKDLAGKDLRIRLRAYGEAVGTTKYIDAICGRMAFLTDRKPFDLGLEWNNYAAEASGPTNAPTSPDLYGRAVMLKLLVIARS